VEVLGCQDLVGKREASALAAQGARSDFREGGEIVEPVALEVGDDVLLDLPQVVRDRGDEKAPQVGR